MDLLDLTRRYPRLSLLAAAFLVGLVGFLDYETGVEIGFSIFYFFPVALSAWYLGQRVGMGIAALSAVVWFSCDSPFGGHVYSHPAIPYWNAFMRGSVFAIVAFLVARLRAAASAEQEASRWKGDMLALVNHEFGNALTSMTLALQFLRSEEPEPLPEGRARLYAAIDRSRAMLRQMVGNFLNSTRLTSGKLALRLRPTDVVTIVDETVTLLSPLAAQKEIHLERDIPASLPQLEADADALAIVLTNLVGNAIKYTPARGRVMVRLSREGSRVVVSIEDTGVGIDDHERKNVLAGYHRTDRGRQLARGFGFGLKVTQELLLGHGSALELESEAGKGSRFFFGLPVRTG